MVFEQFTGIPKLVMGVFVVFAGGFFYILMGTKMGMVGLGLTVIIVGLGLYLMYEYMAHA